MLLTKNWDEMRGSAADLAPARRLGPQAEDSAKQTVET